MLIKVRKVKKEMYKKIMILGIVCMFLLTSLLVGTAVGEKTTQATGALGKDLSIEFVNVYENGNNGKISKFYGKITNVGTEPVKGPVNVGLFNIQGLRYPKNGFPVEAYFPNVLNENQVLNPGESVKVMGWIAYPPRMWWRFPTLFYTFQYSFVDEYSDDNPANNQAVRRYLSLPGYMYCLW